MEEKKEIKIRLSTFLLIISIIVIIVMGIFMYKLNNDKNTLIQKNTELQAQVGALNTKDNSLSSAVSKYNKNFSNSVFNKLNKETSIVVPIWAYNNYSEVTINKNHEAFWNNQGNDTFPETSNNKVASNVINAWYCPLGQDIKSNGCLLFLKEDGSVTYIRFYLDNSSTGNQFVNVTEEKTLKEISDISNVLVVEDGFYGTIFIKEDGTTLSVSLTKLPTESYS